MKHGRILDITNHHIGRQKYLGVNEEFSNWFISSRRKVEAQLPSKPNIQLGQSICLQSFILINVGNKKNCTQPFFHSRSIKHNRLRGPEHIAVHLHNQFDSSNSIVPRSISEYLATRGRVLIKTYKVIIWSRKKELQMLVCANGHKVLEYLSGSGSICGEHG